MIDSFVIKIYNNSIFVGYIKDTRLHRNGYYRFNKTKNIDKCMKYHTKWNSDAIVEKLSRNFDILHYYKSSYKFECKLITNQEIRLSKLNVLNKKIIKIGIFKNRIL